MKQQRAVDRAADGRTPRRRRPGGGNHRGEERGDRCRDEDRGAPPVRSLFMLADDGWSPVHVGVDDQHTEQLPSWSPGTRDGAARVDSDGLRGARGAEDESGRESESERTQRGGMHG